MAKLLETTAGLYDNPTYSDVTIRLATASEGGDEEGDKIHCHKFILSIRNKDWAKADVLDWRGLDPGVAHTVAKWVYTNRVDFDGKDDGFVLSLMRKAKEFGLPDLMATCQESLLASVQVHNCIRYVGTLTAPTFSFSFDWKFHG